MRGDERVKKSGNAHQSPLSGPTNVIVVPKHASTHIFLVGEIDMVCQPELDAALQQVAARPAGPITVNMAQLAFLGTCGLEFLAELHNTVHAAGYAVTLIVPPAQVSRVLALTGLAERFSVRGAPRR